VSGRPAHHDADRPADPSVVSVAALLPGRRGGGCARVRVSARRRGPPSTRSANGSLTGVGGFALQLRHGGRHGHRTPGRGSGERRNGSTPMNPRIILFGFVLLGIACTHDAATGLISSAAPSNPQPTPGSPSPDRGLV